MLGEIADRLDEMALRSPGLGWTGFVVPAFALGDYEWILAFEAPELHRIVDLMRELRATDARRHTREETPFFTGPRVPVEQLVNALP